MSDTKQGSALADELIASMREGVEILAGTREPAELHLPGAMPLKPLSQPKLH